jgi:ADP-heptose:LPS heptosyltransferase
MKIVVRTPTGIGGNVLALPALFSLKENYPGAEVWVAGRPWIQELLPPGREFAGVIPLPEDENIRDLHESSRRLKEGNFSAGLLLADTFASALDSKPINLAGRTSVRGLMGVLGQASLVVANDSGSMHIANALGVPVVAVFGPTDPRISGPARPPAAVVKKDMPCWPCQYAQCPYDHRCMTAIEAEDVFAAGQRFL